MWYPFDGIVPFSRCIIDLYTYMFVFAEILFEEKCSCLCFSNSNRTSGVYLCFVCFVLCLNVYLHYYSFFSMKSVFFSYILVLLLAASKSYLFV